MHKLFTLFFSFSTFLMFAQKAAISGTVKGNGDELPSAVVLLDNSAKMNVLTEMDGSFELVDIPYGKHTISVRYIGFLPFTKEINVNVKTIDLGVIELKDDAKNLSEVEIKAELKKGSENKAISLTKESKKIITIVSSETIKKLPDRNAAEAVRRVAGVAITYNKGEGSQVSLRGTPNDWTSTLVNGDRLPVADEENQSRSFEFEVLPADLVDYIMIARSATPDLEADNVGGTINYLTKSAVDKRTLTINVGAGFNVLAKKPLGLANILWGDRSKNGKFGYVVNLSYYGRNYATDCQRFMYGNNFNHAIDRYELKQYSGTRNTIGTNIAFDYEVNKKAKIGAKFMQGAMLDDKWQNKEAYVFTSGDGTTFKEQFIHGKLNRTLYGGEFNTEIKASDKVRLNIRIATYYNQFGYGNVPYKKANPANGYFTAEFQAVPAQVSYLGLTDILQNGQVNTGQSQAGNADWGPAMVLNIDGGNSSYTNVKPVMAGFTPTDSNMSFFRAFSETNLTQEQDPYVLQWDLHYQVSNKVRLQFGMKDRMKMGSRTLGYYEWDQYTNNGQNQHRYYMTDFASQPNTFGSFLTEYGAPYSNIGLSMMTHDQLANLLPTMENRSGTQLLQYDGSKPSYTKYWQWIGSTYNYREFQNGAYAMVSANLGQVDIVGGLRVEHTVISESAYDSDTVSSHILYDSTMTSLTGTVNPYSPRISASMHQSYFSFLPSLNLTYHVREDMNLRFAFSRTFHRQNFQELKPGAGLINYSAFQLTYGNPNLKPAYAYNFDLMYELFWGNKGMFSIGGYAKYVTNHIFEITSAATDPALAGFVIRTFGNAGNSYILGAEANISRKFDFLPRALGGFGISGNVTYSYSRMKVPGRPSSQAMAEQTPLLYNIALFYEKYGVSARIAYNYQGAFLKGLNLATDPLTKDLLHTNSDFDMFQAAMYTLDFSIAYTFKERYTVMVEGNNLLDCPMKEYYGNPNRPYRIEYYKQKVSVGFKFDL